MGCKSAIYTVNQTETELQANSQIPIGGVIRRFGQCIRLEGDNVTCCSNGYYLVNASVTLRSVAEGDISAALYLNGTQYTGAEATETAAGAGDAVDLEITSIVRVMCGNASSISLRLGDAAASIANVALTVVKL